MSLIIKCTTKSYAGATVKSCLLKNPEADLEVEVVSSGGRVNSIKYGSGKTELVDFHTEVLHALPVLLALERAQVTWDKVGLGGERTWVAPQSSFSGGVPFLDLNLGEYTLNPTESGVALTSPLCRETGLQVIRTIKMETGAHAVLKITSQVSNHSQQSREASPWHILQTPVPTAVLIGPLSQPPEVFSEFGNPLEVKGFASQQGNGYWRLAFADLELPMFKLGFHFSAETGTIRAIYPNGKGRIVQVIETFPTEKAKYPHKGPAEIFYNPSGKYVELEVLGGMQTLSPGQGSKKLEVKIEISPR